MFNWDNLILIEKKQRGEAIHLFAEGSYIMNQLNGKELSLHEKTSQLTKIRSLDYTNSSPELKGTQKNIHRIKEENMEIIFWLKPHLDLLIVNFQVELDRLWIYHAIEFLRSQQLQITVNNILEMRYKYLRIPSYTQLWDYYYQTDLFATFPETRLGKPLPHMASSLIIGSKKDFSNVLEVILHIHILFSMRDTFEDPELLIQDMREFSNDIDEYIENKKEVMLIKTNIFYAVLIKLLAIDVQSILEEWCYELKKSALDLHMKELVTVFDLLGAWFFGSSLENYEINEFVLPVPLTLIPHILGFDHINLSNDELEHKLYNMVSLSINVLSSPEYDIGLDRLQELLGDLYYKVNDFTSSSRFYRFSIDMHRQSGKHQLVVAVKEKGLKSDIAHYTELAIAANLYHYSQRSQEAISLGWSALLQGLSTLSNSVEYNLKIREYCSRIMEYYHHATRPLFAMPDDETGSNLVVRLKLDELSNFYAMIQSDELPREEIGEMIEMHRESLKFMMPHKPPLFLLMTVDGRYLYAVEATADAEGVHDSSMLHLIAGALTAIRTILEEATMSSSGAVREISAGDSILLIEAREGLVLVTSAITVDDNLRRFSTNLADGLSSQFGEAIIHWMGDSVSIEPIMNYMNKKIKSELL